MKRLSRGSNVKLVAGHRIEQDAEPGARSPGRADTGISNSVAVSATSGKVRNRTRTCHRDGATRVVF